MFALFLVQNHNKYKFYNNNKRGTDSTNKKKTVGNFNLDRVELEETNVSSLILFAKEILEFISHFRKENVINKSTSDFNSYTTLRRTRAIPRTRFRNHTPLESYHIKHLQRQTKIVHYTLTCNYGANSKRSVLTQPWFANNTILRREYASCIVCYRVWNALVHISTSMPA